MYNVNTKIADWTKKFHDLKYAKQIKISLILLGVFIAMTIFCSIVFNLRSHKANELLKFQKKLYEQGSGCFITTKNLLGQDQSELQEDYKVKFEIEYKEKNKVRSTLLKFFFPLSIFLAIPFAIVGVLYCIPVFIVLIVVFIISGLILGNKELNNQRFDFRKETLEEYTTRMKEYKKVEKSKLQKIRNLIANIILYSVIILLILPLLILLSPLILGFLFNAKKEFIKSVLQIDNSINEVIDAYLILGFSNFKEIQENDIEKKIKNNYHALSRIFHPDKHKNKEDVTNIFQRIANSKKITNDDVGISKIKFTEQDFNKRKKKFDELQENKNISCENSDNILNIFECAIKNQNCRVDKQKEVKEEKRDGVVEKVKRVFISLASRVYRQSDKKPECHEDQEGVKNNSTVKNLERVRDIIVNTTGCNIIIPENIKFKTILQEMKKGDPDDGELQKFTVDQAGDSDGIYYDKAQLTHVKKQFLLKKINEEIEKKFSNPSANTNLSSVQLGDGLNPASVS